jgi:Protein of unknown function (DUF3800)
MHIYIDESGIFRNPANADNVASCIAALAVPTTKKKELFNQFKRLTHGWGDNGEVKGKSLDEAQIASVIALLQKFDVLLQIAAIDLGVHTEDEITKFKKQQAENITANITPQHHPNVVRQSNEIRATFEKMPNQLFVQAMLMFLLIPRTLLHMIWYYARRIPEELQWFYWMVDAKEQSKTAYEKAWSTAIFPIMSTMSANDPVSFVEGGDYTYFERFEERDTEWIKQIENEKSLGRGELVAAKLGEVIGEHFSFQDSKYNLGLQMADILANATQRAMNRKLKLTGWRDIGRLIMTRRPTAIQFVHITTGPKTNPVATPFHSVIRIIDTKTKSLWLDPAGEALLDQRNRDKNKHRTRPLDKPLRIDLNKLP